MWGSLLGLAFLFTINPVLLAVIVLMISRPRPVQNLLAYWLGSMIVNIAGMVIPLIVLRSTPAFPYLGDPASAGTSAGARYFQIGMGVLALSIATLITVRLVAHQRAQLATSDGNSSVLVMDADESTQLSSPFGRAQDTANEGGSAFRRLVGRLQNAWDDGALWVAFVFGLCGFPPPILVLFVDTTIMGSGAAFGVQVVAAVAFVFGMFAVVEIALVSYLIVPDKTLAVLRPLHDWAAANRRQVLIGIFSLVGFFQLGHGLGLI
ncbi:GAP family protein [Mycobacterium vicinigordonae]|uniref:GAP family protein n=1 Tax=Mycobacterium vicinigordonae TaxID=1719132 RepID=A0A7D6HU11_9MYCO|nr:GAP family protein [Mycobacterium vicinigordonae]